MGTIKYLIKIVSLLFLVSCNKGTLPIYFENKTTDIVEIDVKVPGDPGLKYNIATLGLLQVNYSSKFQKIEKKYKDEEANITLDNIYDAFQSNYDGFFNEAGEKTDVEIWELNEYIDLENPFNWESLKKITDSLHFDALIYINNIIIKFEITADIPNVGIGAGFHESKLTCKSIFYYTILYPEKGEFETIVSSFSDDFKSDKNFIGSKAAYLHSTEKIEEVLPYLCYETGKRAIYKIFPVWLTIKRKFYGRATRELRQARRFVYKGMWKEAIQIWEENKNHENKVLAKHCQFNLILAEELTGSLETAAQMAELYFYKYNEEIAREYYSILIKRIHQLKKLKNKERPE